MNKEKLGRKIIENLHQAGFEAYFAGGCVRDRERGVAPKDFDITTSATPDQITQLFSKTVPVGAAFGVILVIEDDIPFEVATFRKEGPYQDGRHPEKVSFSTVEEDVQRRDFTVNGLYLDIRNNQVIDLVGGREDLQKKIIRTIGDPEKRFLEDHLRLMRAIRFAVQLGFEIESATFAAIKKHAKKISLISAERVRDEFTKILTSPQPARGIRLLDETGLAKEFFPELSKMKGVEQPMEYHPEGDVFIHTLLLLDGLKNAEIELAMGALLHDVAKPNTFQRAPDRIRFHGHDVLGAQMAREICKRLAFSNEQTELIASLVLEHLRFKDVFNMRLSTLKRFLSLPRFDLHLEQHRLDCLASYGNLDAYQFAKVKYEEFLKEPPPPSKLVTGADLKAFGFVPGPIFTEILRDVEDQILEGAIRDREEALDYVKKKVFNQGAPMNGIEDFKKGDLRTLARLISLCEDGDPKVIDFLSEIFLLKGHAKVIGITGPPGAGKSTLLNTFVRLIRKENKKVAVLAVDPVSPFSGGALLGDRIRLMDHFNDPNVFIRSLSTRGKLGGLSLATRQGVTLLDKFGFDFILVETVGVGQSEVDVRKLADVTLVALVPEWGDSIQALKAGILEIADIFVVNKADREGADRIEKELKNVLHLAGKDETPVLKTSFNDLTTVEALYQSVNSYLDAHSPTIEKKREVGIQDAALELLEYWVMQEARTWLKDHMESGANPYEVIKQFQKKYPKGSLFS